MKPKGVAGDRRPAGPVRRELASLGRRPRKRFGQHFLADPHIAQRIVDLARLTGRERVVEIGPGLGALSDILVRQSQELWLIEIDTDLANRLRARFAPYAHVHVLAADVLAIDFAALLGTGKPAVAVGNLPYNIAAAVLTRLLAHHECFRCLVLMLQREVVERVRAQPGSKDYGTLSVFTQLAARIGPGMRVGPGAFVPQPKVESEVIVVEPYSRPPVALKDPTVFARLVRAVFTQRRKQLINSLRPVCGDPIAVLRAAGIDPTRRPQTLTLEEFAALSNCMAPA